jgi:hypothetical protein
MSNEIAMSDSQARLGLDSSRSLASLRANVTSRPGILASLALALCCFLISTVAVSSFWLIIAAVAVIPVAIAGCLTFGSRSFAVFGLVFSSSLQLVHHFVYLPYIGASDGLTVELTDVWTIWLAFIYVAEHQKGIAKAVHGFTAFVVPLTLLLIADIFSFVNSADMQLSFYGMLAHLRVAALFVVLAATLAQGTKELRAASFGVVCAVLSMGGICIVEMIFRTNIPKNAALIAEAGESDFRAGGISAPTLAAALLATLLPLVMIEYFCPLSRFRKILAGVTICVGLAGIGCTLTRAAAGTLVVGSIPLVVFLFRHHRIRARHLIACFVVLSCLWASLGDKISERVDEGADNLDARLGLIGTALNMASHSPLVGEGINNYALKMNGFIPNDQRQKFEYVVHNKFFLTLAETGIIGLVALMWLLAIAFRRAILLARRGSPMGVGVLCSMIVLVLEMNVESYDSGMNLFFAFILMAVIAAMWSGELVKTQTDAGIPIGSTVRVSDSSLPVQSAVLKWKQ